MPYYEKQVLDNFRESIDESINTIASNYLTVKDGVIKGVIRNIKRADEMKIKSWFIDLIIIKFLSEEIIDIYCNGSSDGKLSDNDVYKVTTVFLHLLGKVSSRTLKVFCSKLSKEQRELVLETISDEYICISGSKYEWIFADSFMWMKRLNNVRRRLGYPSYATKLVDGVMLPDPFY